MLWSAELRGRCTCFRGGDYQFPPAALRLDSCDSWRRVSESNARVANATIRFRGGAVWPLRQLSVFVVSPGGFEPPASCSRSRRAGPAALQRDVMLVETMGVQPTACRLQGGRSRVELRPRADRKGRAPCFQRVGELRGTRTRLARLKARGPHPKSSSSRGAAGESRRWGREGPPLPSDASPTVAPSRSLVELRPHENTPGPPPRCGPAAGHCHIQVVKDRSACPVAMPERCARAHAPARGKLVPHPGFEPGTSRF